MINLRHLSIQGMDCDYGDHTTCWTISKIPLQIKNLKKLETLRLNVNAITFIPIELAELRNLKVLDLTDNPGLSNVDNVIYIQNIEDLSLNGCSISKLPESIGELKKLKSLGLSGNHIDEKERLRLKKVLFNCKIYF